MSRAAAAITTPVTNAAKQSGQPRLVPVDKNVLRELITRHFVSIRLVDRGTSLECEYYSFDFPLEADSSKEPNKRILIDMIAALVLRVAKGPSAPHRLSEQQQQEVRARLKEGEPGVLSRGYGVDVETIGRLVR